MLKIYKSLTDDQKKRGVIFSSTLSTTKNDDESDRKMHEVFKTESKAEIDRKIRLLTDDSFFNFSPWKYNIIRK